MKVRILSSVMHYLYIYIVIAGRSRCISDAYIGIITDFQAFVIHMKLLLIAVISAVYDALCESCCLPAYRMASP